jgi:hypothetical protein
MQKICQHITLATLLIAIRSNQLDCFNIRSEYLSGRVVQLRVQERAPR